MKKYFTLFIALFIFSIGQAQDLLSLEVGAKGGWTSTKLHKNDFTFGNQLDINRTKVDAKSGYLFGVWGKLNVSNYILVLEGNYVKRRIHTQGTIEGTLSNNYTSSFSLCSFDIPLKLGYTVYNGKWFSVFGLTGPSLIIYLNNSDIKHTVTDTQNQIRNITAGDFSNTSWGYYLEGGVRFLNLSVTAGYEWGLSSIEENINNIPGIENKTGMFVLSLNARLIKIL